MSYSDEKRHIGKARFFDRLFLIKLWKFARSSGLGKNRNGHKTLGSAKVILA